MIILAILLGVLFTALLVMFIDWKESSGKHPRIKFEDFKKFYALNHNRWYIYDARVECRIPWTNAWSGSNESFVFNFVDYYKDKLWYRNLNK